MAKKVKAVVKLQIPAGKANPAPPVGTALVCKLVLVRLIGRCLLALRFIAGRSMSTTESGRISNFLKVP
jgi:hypothetical protein